MFVEPSRRFAPAPPVGAHQTLFADPTKKFDSVFLRNYYYFTEKN